MKRSLSAPLAALALVVLLAGCASKDKDAYVERPVNELYNEAADNLDNGKYVKAAELFNEVERQHPYSQWATRAQLMAAYAHYKALNYDECLAALDRFIQLHPGHKDAAYAYYMRALAYYEQISDVRRDQRMTELALDSLQELTRRFPDTSYARDATLKLDLTRDHLAGKEMEVGRYYLTREMYQAAIPRFQAVVDSYQTTSHVPEALHRLVECYLALGLTGEAQRNAAVLGHNFPGSKWYDASYQLLTDEDAAGRSPKGFLAKSADWVF